MHLTRIVFLQIIITTPCPTLPYMIKKTCFSPNDKLVNTNNNNWTHVFENAKHSVVKVAVSNSYMNRPEISTGFIYDYDGHIVTNCYIYIDRLHF